MFTLLGGGTASVLSSLTFLGVNFSIGEDSPAFMQWGWRIPFMISAALIVIALYVRLRIDETPVFAEEKARNLVPTAPIAELLRLQRREILLAAGSILGGFGFAYMGNTYLTVYAHFHLGYTRSFIWAVGALGGLASITFVALSASLSDRVGRRRMMLLGWAGCVPWALAVIPLMDTGKPILYAVAIVGMSAIGAVGSGPTGAFIPELFATRYRYSGSALAVNTAGVFGGALPPLIAGALQATYGSWAVGPMLAILALASFVCTYLLPETRGTSLQSTPGAGVAAVPSKLELPGGGR
jgi:MFS family permease